MSILNKVYSCSINNMNKPVVIMGTDAIGSRLMNLIMMEPGDDPLHPDMGLGLKKYRYSIDTIDKMKERLDNQIATYLPFYQNVNISIITTPDKICNIEIGIGGVTYVYDSNAVSKPIVLSDLKG